MNRSGETEYQNGHAWPLPDERDDIQVSGQTIPVLEALVWIATGKHFPLNWPRASAPHIGRTFDRAYRMRRLELRAPRPFTIADSGFMSFAKLVKIHYADRNKAASERQRCKENLARAKGLRFARCIVDPAESDFFAKCQSGALTVEAAESETSTQVSPLPASYFDCPIAIQLTTGNLEFDASSDIDTYFKWREKAALQRYRPRVDIEALLAAYPCAEGPRSRTNDSGRRRPTPTDERQFRTWLENRLSEDGKPPTLEQSYSWAAARGLSQRFIKKQRRNLPEGLKRARGEKG